MVFQGVAYWHGSTPGKVNTLLAFRQYGMDNSPLPRYEFTYGDTLHLTRASNALGGVVEFDYDSTPWYYSTDARETYTIDYTFPGGVGQPCSYWSGNVGCNTQRLAVNGTAQSSQVPAIKPGGAYKVSATYDPLPAGVTLQVRPV